ncbi:MAG: PfkB family carbohydrate kinase, partial [Rhodobacteraceae bacterium]|nr:PfkB family carbohydrate kinase [Paracoccaceae bacterium]
MFVVGGENLIDFIQENSGDGLPCYRAVPGGSPYNVAKALALQQVDTGYLTPVSSDSLGDLLVAGLPENHLTLLAARSKLPSALAVVSLKAGQAEYGFYRQGTAERDVTLGSLSASLPDKLSGFYIGSLAITDGADADAWEIAWIGAHQRGVFSVIDPNIRPDFILDRDGYLARLNRMLVEADLVKLSDEDIAWISPDMPLLEAAKQMFEASSAALLVLTLGSKGAVAFTSSGQ